MKNSLKRAIPFSFASKTIVVLNSAVVIFHILVLAGAIPYNVVWAGKLKSKGEMYMFESVSIIINLFLIAVVLIKTGSIKIKIPRKLINVILWLFVVVFILNTIGNITSSEKMEAFIATPLTFILALFCWRVAAEKNGGPEAGKR